MGYVLSSELDGFPNLRIEVRRESLYLRAVNDDEIFAYGHDGDNVTIEVTHVWLAELLRFFDDPANRELCRLPAPAEARKEE